MSAGKGSVVARHPVAALYLQDLTPGDEWESPARTVTEADVVNFAGLSGDFNPLHMDHHQAHQGAFGRPIAHGLLGLAIASGLASHAPRVRTLAFLSIQEWSFLEPILLGDTIHVLTRVDRVEPGPRGRRGVVTWRRQLVNQRGAVVQAGTTRTLVQGRPDAAGPTLPAAAENDQPA
jgi:3-hydroxybutyryl-CoA dehydratase